MTESPGDLARVQARYREVNGDHPMSPEDDAYVRAEFVEATGSQLAEMVAGRMPLPSYLLSGGTPMVAADHDAPAEWAGGVDRLRDWFVAHWGPGDREEADREWAAYLSGQHFGLRSVAPVTIRDQTMLVGRIREAVAVLEQRPHDAVARGSLDESVERLDRLLRPMTGYDRLRLGGPTARETWVGDVRRDHLAHEHPELPLRTERLVLRRRTVDDAEATHALHGDEDVTRYLLHEPWDLLETRHRMRHWVEPSPHNLALGVEIDGELVGEVVLLFRGASQAEVGWVLHPGAAGRGIATEAAAEMLRVGFEHYGFHRIYAELDARNGPSARVAERLGMRLEAHRLGDFWCKGEWTDSLQYALLDTEWSAHDPRSAP